MKLVKAEVSGIIAAPIGTVWKLVSFFCDSKAYTLSEDQVHHLLANDTRPPSMHIQQRRAVRLGSGRIHEELMALDHHDFSMQYRLVSDDRNINPFPASFLDVVSQLTLQRCSMDDSTFIKVISTFRTEIEMTGIMQAMWERILQEMVVSLQKSLAHKPGKDKSSDIMLHLAPRPSCDTSPTHAEPASALYLEGPRISPDLSAWNAPLPMPAVRPTLDAFSQRTISTPAFPHRPQLWTAARTSADFPPGPHGATMESAWLMANDAMPRCISDPLRALNGVDAMSRSASMASLASLQGLSDEAQIAKVQDDVMACFANGPARRLVVSRASLDSVEQDMLPPSVWSSLGSRAECMRHYVPLDMHGARPELAPFRNLQQCGSGSASTFHMDSCWAGEAFTVLAQVRK